MIEKFLTPAAVAPPLDPGFRSAALARNCYRRWAAAEGRALPIRIAVRQGDGSTYHFDWTVARGDDSATMAVNLFMLERQIKSLLWIVGGHQVWIQGPAALVGLLRDYVFATAEPQIFDADVMGETIYGKPFEILHATEATFPEACEKARPLGRHMDGCRMSIDYGASDRKRCAVVDGRVVFTEEVPWDPTPQSDPAYHFAHIVDDLKATASKLPRVDAVGISAAGVYVANQPRIASLFRGVPRSMFPEHVATLFARGKAVLEEHLGYPVAFEVCNDGTVAALAGSMSLERNAVLGLSMGSSEAGGFVDPHGHVRPWLDELAFVPVDYRLRRGAPQDPWSRDFGVGAQYFSQQAVHRHIGPAGIALPAGMPVPEQLVEVQKLMQQGDRRARAIFETIGVEFGHALALYAGFYPFNTVLVMGRVTTGEGGDIIVAQAGAVLDREFPELAGQIEIRLPDEASKRVGQAVAAASLPPIVKESR